VIIRGECIIISTERVVIFLEDLSRHSFENNEKVTKNVTDDRYGLKVFNLTTWRRIYTERIIAALDWADWCKQRNILGQNRRGSAEILNGNVPNTNLHCNFHMGAL
jgi:hypothetical protein